MKSISLVFDTKIMKVAGSLKSNTSLMCKEAHVKVGLLILLYNVAILDLETVELNIIKMLK